MKILHLTLKKEWFDMILSGEKTEEYREIKPHWFVRLFEGTKYVCKRRIQIECGLLKSRGSVARYVFNNKTYSFKLKDYDVIKFTNGYGKNAPYFYIELKGIQVRTGLARWGAVPKEEYFVLSLGEIINYGI